MYKILQSYLLFLVGLDFLRLNLSSKSTRTFSTILPLFSIFECVSAFFIKTMKKIKINIYG